MGMPIFLTVTCYMIPEALKIISIMCMILLSNYVFPLASLNTENTSVIDIWILIIFIFFSSIFLILLFFFFILFSWKDDEEGT